MADNFSEIVKLCRVDDETQVSEGLTFTLGTRITADDWSFKLITGEQSDAGGGGQPRDAGAGLQHGQGGWEPHEARLRPQDLSHTQRLPQRQRGYIVQLQNVQRYAGKIIEKYYSLNPI